MGKVFSQIKHPFRNYNVEGRAHRVISKQKPIAAPRYPADVAEYEKILKDHPEIIANSLKKHSDLDENLRNVFVTSKDPSSKSSSDQKSTKPLPVVRKQVDDYEFGFKEPSKIPIGKASLKTIMEFVGMYQRNPRVNTAAKIAAEYEIDEEKIRNILKYVRLYEVYIPDDQKTKAHFAGPSQPSFLRKIPRLKLSSSFTKEKANN